MPSATPATDAAQAADDVRTKETATALVAVASRSHSLPYLRSVSAEAPTPTYSVLMTTIGLGIDPFCGAAGRSTTHATVAAVKAVQDAMERGILRFPADYSDVYLHIQLGVPPGVAGGTEPMYVDITRLTPLLPSFISLLPVEILVGGLFVDTNPDASSSPHRSTACTAIACITLQKATAITTARRANDSDLTSPTSVAAQTSADKDEAMPIAVPTCWDQVEQAIAAPLQEPSSLDSRRRDVFFHRSTSIDMLAHVSAELHEQPLLLTKSLSCPAIKRSYSQAGLDDDTSEAEESASNNTSTVYNYKKLPPGVTPKNNKRRFVLHTYQDFSNDQPTPEEQSLMGSSRQTRSLNAAFPLKLHETLALIEREGHQDVVGWLPHGRSFKIHQQKEFVESILPKYFVMTKKSSFLRQLNLYGFNRLSGIGLGHGSYYHELFLRGAGVRFLCRRIHRQKVNGNGIRSAGNPDCEPDLNRFPICPPHSTSLTVPPTVASMLLDAISASTPPAAAVVATEAGRIKERSVSDVKKTAVGEKARGSPVFEQSNPNLAAVDDDPQSDSLPGHAISSAMPCTFPLKLQRILDKLESEGSSDVISWLAHGRAFMVHDGDRFVRELMPLYFNQTKYSSFQRQLHMYHFQRITSGPDKGAYHHASFQRNRPELCYCMQRTRVNGMVTRRPANPDAEPDLHTLTPIPPIPRGTIIDVPNESPSLNTEDENSQGSLHNA
jgi:hypothetical protein